MEIYFVIGIAKTQETTKRPRSRGFKKLSGFGNSSLQGTKAPSTLVLLCFGAIREGMIRDRSLLTS